MALIRTRFGNGLLYLNRLKRTETARNKRSAFRQPSLVFHVRVAMHLATSVAEMAAKVSVALFSGPSRRRGTGH